jgi:hypothetical protein
MKSTHRGRPKEGLMRMTVHLTKEEKQALNDLAEDNCRTAPAQAVWLIKCGIAAHNAKTARTKEAKR